MTLRPCRRLRGARRAVPLQLRDHQFASTRANFAREGWQAREKYGLIPKRGPQRFGDVFDLRACQFGVKGNRQHFAGRAFADPEIAWLSAKRRVQRLKV